MQNTLTLLVKYEPIFILVLLILVIIALIWAFFLNRSLKTIRQHNLDFFSGSKVKNIEDVVVGHARAIKALDKDIQELYNISNQINTLAHRGLHKFAMIRFNPFKEVGGDQSFAIALLNSKNNGLVISSLYTREGTRIYAKAISSSESEKYPLTEEEKQAIKLAHNSSSVKNKLHDGN